MKNIKHTPVIKEKTIIKSTTDPDRGYSSQENKEGFGYLSEMTVDTDNGIVLGVDCYPANQRESNIPRFTRIVNAMKPPSIKE